MVKDYDPRTATGVRPERSFGKGWSACEPHAAHRWAAYLRGSLVGRYACKRKAVENLSQAAARKKPMPRAYKLGRRMEKLS